MSAARRLPLSHPAAWLATWFGCGLLPAAPGSWGSLAALPLAWLLLWLGGAWALLAGAGIVFLVGWWASEVYAKALGGKDPREVVVDEVAGQFIALLPAALAPLPFAVGFLLFRLFDIVKPWPIRRLENLPGGLGIMADDLLAGIYAALVLLAGEHFLAR